MNGQRQSEPIQIKKYPNRRFYDATRSCHVTLQDISQAIRSGFDVVVTDSRNGADITNVVLLQIILEKDEPKLDLFPSAVLHLMIRTDYPVLRDSIERFFGPYMSMLSATQRQFDTYLRQAMRGQFVSPLDWATSFLRTFNPARAAPAASATPETPSTDDVVTTQNLGETVADLRRQMAELAQRIADLGASRAPQDQE
ncbi:MAG: hypothetical protein HY763_14320 [Planctomycetes bacterium]|nr:hypothetical protein [Planctomycetota bacterium]